MNWTKEKPTMPGYYNVRGIDGTISIYEIVKFKGILCKHIKELHIYIDLSDTIDSVEWLGPLPE